MQKEEFSVLLTNGVDTFKNTLKSLIIKFFNENQNSKREVVFDTQSYYVISSGFCFPKRMYIEENTCKTTKRKIMVEREFEYDDYTTDYEVICIDDMGLVDLVNFCYYIDDTFNK